jgi:hypothetical protein
MDDSIPPQSPLYLSAQMKMKRDSVRVPALVD